MIRKTSILLLFFSLFSCDSSPSRTDVVAKVNKTTITVEQFQAQANKASQFPGTDFTLGEQKRELLQEMIRQELLFQAALHDQIFEKSPRLKQEIAAEYLHQKVGKAPTPTDAEIEAYLESKKNDLEKVRVSHILIRPKDPKDSKSWEEAKVKAEMVFKKMKADGSKVDFSKYAKEYSEDVANNNSGGDLGFFNRSMMVAAFNEAAFKLKKIGDLSDIIKTEFGYHIIQLTGDQRSMETQKPALVAQLTQQKQAEMAKQLLDELEKKARISIQNDVLTNLNITENASQQLTQPKK